MPRVKRALAVAAAGAGAMLAGCAAPAPKAAPVAMLTHQRVARLGVVRATRPRIVVASWYGPGFDGKRTRSGEIFHQSALTAASMSLPIGTRVRVTNLANHKSVVVRINDRGPRVRGRAIDLSRHAARIIGLVHRGVALVKLERIVPKRRLHFPDAEAAHSLAWRLTSRRAS